MQLKVVAVSKNRNGFGLKGMILMSRTGYTFTAAANDINIKPAGTVLEVGEDPFDGLAGHGFEIPSRFKDEPAPPEVIAEVWAESYPN